MPQDHTKLQTPIYSGVNALDFKVAKAHFIQ